jgi:hypothetical protein
MTDGSEPTHSMVPRKTLYRMLEMADRIEQLETLLKRLDDCFQRSAPLFGAQWCRSVHISDALIEDVRAAVGEKKGD